MVKMTEMTDTGTTLASKLKQLLIIQERDRKLLRLEQETQDIPLRKSQFEELLSDDVKAVEAAKEQVQKISVQIKELEGQVDAEQQRVTKYKEQQLQVKNNDEYRALTKEIETVGNDVALIEERELGFLEELEAAKVVLIDYEKRLKEERARIDEDLKTLDGRAKDLEAQVEQISSDRSKLAEQADPSWLNRYNRILANKKDVAIVPVQNQTCGGCHMRVTPQTAHHARDSSKMTTCDYCSRILFYVE